MGCWRTGTKEELHAFGVTGFAYMEIRREARNTHDMSCPCTRMIETSNEPDRHIIMIYGLSLPLLKNEYYPSSRHSSSTAEASRIPPACPS